MKQASFLTPGESSGGGGGGGNDCYRLQLRYTRPIELMSVVDCFYFNVTAFHLYTIIVLKSLFVKCSVRHLWTPLAGRHRSGAGESSSNSSWCGCGDVGGLGVG